MTALQPFPYKLVAHQGTELTQVRCPSCLSTYLYDFTVLTSPDSYTLRYSRFGNILLMISSLYKSVEIFRYEIDDVLCKGDPPIIKRVSIKFEKCPYCDSPISNSDITEGVSGVYYELVRNVLEPKYDNVVHGAENILRTARELYKDNP